MATKDYYKIMGVARDASQKDIKRAYHRLARKFHPDVSKAPDAAERFKEIGEAYAVLSDPEKRAAYDQFGEYWEAGQQAQQQQSGGWQQDFGQRQQSFNGGDFSDFFSDIFGQRGFGGFNQQGRRGFAQRGEDIHAKIQIDIEDSYHGASRSISVATPNGKRTLNVRIPRGVMAGQQIRLAGQGEQGFGGGARGDLLLEVEFRAHPRYRVEGRDVYLRQPVSPWEAALGAKVTVPTPTGNIDIKIPANSSADRKLRLKGKGLPAKQPGDLFVELTIALPEANTPQAKAAYEAFRDAFEPRQS